MKKLVILLTLIFTCMSLFANVAEAKRFGGGSSFGKQRSVPQQAQRAPQAAPQQATSPSQAPVNPTGNRWLGPLAGLALGAGLASLFAGSGVGGMLGPIVLAVLLGVVVMLVLSRLKKPAPVGMAYAGNQPSAQPYQAPAQQANRYSNAKPFLSDEAVNKPQEIPADFPVDAFLRNGKASFIRLQAANDRKDLDDVREYTTPEMFAEVSLQMQERGNTAQITDVLQLEAELLQVVTEGDYMIASVRFIAQLSENKGPTEHVDEIWHVQKNLRDPKAAWLLAGIQQTETTAP